MAFSLTSLRCVVSDGIAVLARPNSYCICDEPQTPSNFRAHYKGTGPEIWRQTCGRLDAFVSGAGEQGM